jgi:hypothetical protein
MRRIVLAIILASVASGAPALGKPAQEWTHAYSPPAVPDHVFHRQKKRLSVPPHAAFRYRKGGRCHHYHYYKPVVPDC